MRSSIDEALLRAIPVNAGVQNESVNACSYLDLTVKPDTSKMNAISTSTPLADVVAMAENVPSHHSHAQVSVVTAMTSTTTATPTTTSNTLSSLSSSSQYHHNHPPICLVTHLSSNVNQDLAEADQSIENDVTNNENAANSPELLSTSAEHSNDDDLTQNNEIASEGAVGGILSEATASTLPDLAKVTTIANNSTANAATSNCEIDYVDTDL